MQARHTVLVVDDHPVVRRGIVAMLSVQDWIDTIVQAGSVAEALDQAAAHKPSLCVIDVRLGDGSGIDLVRELKQTDPGIRCVVLSMEAEPTTVRKALAAGADGYLVKDSEPELLVDALRTASHGGVVLGHTVAGVGLESPVPAMPPEFASLTRREIDVVGLLGSGKTTGQIARQLGLSEKTVRNLVSVALVKTGSKDRLQLALAAREAGLVDTE